jgi:Competence protein CoiA-like family
VHSAELRRFLGGKETRQLFALDRRTGRIVELHDGGALDLRPDCRAGRLVCPIESCENRAFTTVGGSNRHHFRHRVPGARAHGRESYYHQLGKALLGQGLKDRYPEARVVVDREALDNAQRPDVLVEFPNGRRFAFELQYSQLPVDDWRARHEGYERQGLIDVWLLGHLPPHLRPSRHHRDEQFAWALEVTPLARAIHASGSPVRFFNPDECTIATALLESGDRFLRYWDAMTLAVDPFDACEIRGDRFWAPTDDLEDTARAARLAEERRREEEERLWHAEQERRKRQRKRIAAWKERTHEEALRLWKLEAEPRFLDLVGLARTPPIIEQELRADRGIHMHPAHWHAQLYWRLLHEKIGSSFSFGEAVRPFYATQEKHKRGARIALAGYLFELRRQGYVTFSSERTWIESKILVLADLDHPPESGWRHVRLVEERERLLAVAETGEVIAAVPRLPSRHAPATGGASGREQDRGCSPRRTR